MLNNLIATKKVLGGMQLIYKFDNGYGASLVSHTGSYGGDAGLWELAILDSAGELYYESDITNKDVLGHLTAEEAHKNLVRIKHLHEGPQQDYQDDWLGLNCECDCCLQKKGEL
mgnify:CR=1 FL=1|jgi:hypothetical protein